MITISISLIKAAAILFIYIISLINANVSPDIHFENVVNYGVCETPNSERALCIILEECTYLYNLLNKQPLLEADRIFLKRSQCGSKNGKPLICCPERQISAQSLSTATIETRLRANLPEPGTCSDILISNRIFGGNVTEIGEYPFTVLIEYDKGENKYGFQCGGSLINDRYVLTAAHCVTSIPKTWTLYRVRLGEWDISKERDCEKDSTDNCAEPHIDVPIEKAIPHENYKVSTSSQPHDIALLRLSRSIEYSDFIRPICLPLKDTLKRSNFVGSVMDITGWGKTENGSASNVKLKASVTVVPLSDCQQVYSQRGSDLQSSQMCAGGQQGIDTCRGDSGGPLIGVDTSDKKRAYNFLAGVVSFGPTPCGMKGWPGVYTKVGDYIDWIEQNIEP